MVYDQMDIANSLKHMELNTQLFQFVSPILIITKKKIIKNLFKQRKNNFLFECKDRGQFLI